MKKIFLVSLLSIILTNCVGIPMTNYNANTSINQIAPYPPPQSGYNRFVIYLPKLAEESDYKVDLMIGKNMLSDCNQKHLMGQLKKHTIGGWGYSYYVVESKGDVVSTLKACPFNHERIHFVTMPNNIGFINYNSRVPIVIYAPGDFQVHYRIWSSSKRTSEAEKG